MVSKGIRDFDNVFKMPKFCPLVCLVGPMDKASVYGTGDSGFDSQAGLPFSLRMFMLRLFEKDYVNIFCYGYLRRAT